MWVAALKDLVGRVTQQSDYLKKDFSLVKAPLANGVLAIICTSINVLLRASHKGMTAYGAYQSLKGGFATSSWSLLISHWADIASNNFISPLLMLLTVVSPFIQNSRSHLPMFSTRPLATSRQALLRLHWQCKSLLNNLGLYWEWVAEAVDYQGSHGGQRPSLSGGHSKCWSSNVQAGLWGKKWLNPDFPCHFCWEWDHWAPDCPWVKNGQPPLEDHCVTNPGWRPAKSKFMSSQIVSQQDNIASVSVTPEESSDILVDIGATNHVTSHQAFFTSLCSTNIRQRVASQERLPVEGIGDAIIPVEVYDSLLP
ncbi:uncharacterized protein PGTG_13666 [Puccinia graminis f. sp. tritici CRL 75-36-700-3]|uniref:Uncharacterized protein n=1 Tax=Puccinia graminis f. sp. tritici (strain CRL 75-36-700-3 / race SCCL) TaxID=418459 RepID=E3KT52_PUCGT|nr:uncharacterized protein PGTG_13666 [Puccinia graminis f. sp. tritici CRL 75-36-700-3]EFP87438.2 hypothetical protein PGTG_13666 [Puccinia graminis f. sp. tritici CRL 75-36-700-3]